MIELRFMATRRCAIVIALILRAVLCGYAGVVVAGCFTPTPDPFVAQWQGLIQEKNETAAKCNRQIEELAEFYEKYGNRVDRDFESKRTCLATERSDVRCLSYEQDAIDAMSTMDSQEQPNCATDTDACISMAKRFENNETCFHEKFIQAYSTVCCKTGLSRRCILALDAGAMCHPGLPNLSACNRLVRIQIQAREIAHVLHKDAASIKVPIMIQETPAPNSILPLSVQSSREFTHCTNFSPTTNPMTQ